MKAKPETVLEIAGAILYCVFMYQQIMGEGDMTYARVMHSMARVCQRVARFFGEAGIRAELSYRRAMEIERMN